LADSLFNLATDKMNIKKLLFLLIFPGSALSLLAQHFTEHQYASSDEIFNNPERGFYKYTSRSSVSSSFALSTLENYYNDGFTLIYRIYYLPDFVDEPISQAYLDKIREDFQIIRKAGIKVVLRFAYTSNSTEPYGDATPEQVQEHIAQLKPILHENADVIAVLQAGFIGAWGEWYYTDHFATGSPNNITAEDLEERAELVYSLLDALPASRQIQLRTPAYKMDLFGEDPISAGEAYSGSAKARIAHHNDCFVSSSSDLGTYHSAYDRTYLKEDSKYTSVGGETCRWYQPKSNCDSALVEMARYHWSYINIDYFGNTIQNWKDNGCLDDMQRRLGYRYELISSSLQDSCRQEGSFHGTLRLINTGFSNPYNPRAVELVMRHQVTQKEYFLSLGTDIRNYPPGNESFEIEFQGGIPPEAEDGSYDLFLNLPDPMISIRKDPRYSIRLANEDNWEESTGYNSLSHTLIIHTASSGAYYQGTDYFTESKRHDMPVYRDITVDGRAGDWAKVPPAFVSQGNQHANAIRIYNDSTFLYLLVSGEALYPNSRLFLDTDNDPGTGMYVPNWQANGMDYMVENLSIYTYTGRDGSSAWSWEYVAPVINVSGAAVLEIAVPLDLPGYLPDTIRYAFVNGTAGFTSVEYLPGKTSPSLMYVINSYIIIPPNLFATVYGDNVNLFWGIREDDSLYRIIERSAGEGEKFTVMAVLSPTMVAVTDFSPVAGQTLYYRSFLTDLDQVTPFTPTVKVVTGPDKYRYSQIIIDGKSDDWNAVRPILSAFSTGTYTARSFADTGNLNFLIAGPNISGFFALYLETDNDMATGTSDLPWDVEGVDYLVRQDSLFHFDQEWQYNGKLNQYALSYSTIEFSIPFDHINLGDNTKIHAGLMLYTGSDISYLPFAGQLLTAYERVLPTGPPANFHLSSSAVNPASKIILNWDKCDNCDGHILEKSSGGEGLFGFLAELDHKGYQYIDDSLENNSVYSYRIYSYNLAGRSDYSRVLTGSTHDVGVTPLEGDNPFLIFTDQLSRQIIISIMDTDLNISSVSLYDFSGRLVYSKKYHRIYREFSVPFPEMVLGIYMLQLHSQKGVYSHKVILY
jgi:hypothetical protein